MRPGSVPSPLVDAQPGHLDRDNLVLHRADRAIHSDSNSVRFVSHELRRPAGPWIWSTLAYRRDHTVWLGKLNDFGRLDGFARPGKSAVTKKKEGPATPALRCRCSLPGLAGFTARCWRTHKSRVSSAWARVCRGGRRPFEIVCNAPIQSYACAFACSRCAGHIRWPTRLYSSAPQRLPQLRLGLLGKSRSLLA